MLLAIETSCDDTCAAVLDDEGAVLSNIVSSQLEHERFGGVVPELAARHHLELIEPVIEEALQSAGVNLNQIERLAVTQGPGLAGALLIGISAAKGLAAGLNVPLRAVDHIHGHIAASFLADTDLSEPFICLVASGGHTLLAYVEDDGPNWRLMGSTLDDAAGEAFDKGARLLGLGFPGGPAIQKLAQEGDDQAFDFPLALGVAGLDFSFAGVKTSLLYAVRDLGDEAAQQRKADLAASYQRAIVQQLIRRLEQAVEQTGVKRIAIGGGVAANSLLRQQVGDLGLPVSIPEFQFCTDNAAMIGRAALALADLDPSDQAALDVRPTGKAPR